MLDTRRSVAARLGRTPAQVALAWAAMQPGITSLILGADAPGQLHDNLAALDLELDPVFPCGIVTPEANRMIFGGTTVQGWR